MQETAPQYIERILGNVGGQKPLKIQAGTAQKLARLVKGVPLAKLRRRPAPDRWSVAEILVHLADTEIVQSFRMRMILGAPGTPIQGFDQDAWVAAGHYAKRDPRKCIEQFRAAREVNLDLLKTLTKEQWQHHGVHSERGKETIDHIVRMVAGHDVNHLRQIERILAKAKG